MSKWLTTIAIVAVPLALIACVLVVAGRLGSASTGAGNDTRENVEPLIAVPPSTAAPPPTFAPATASAPTVASAATMVDGVSAPAEPLGDDAGGPLVPVRAPTSADFAHPPPMPSSTPPQSASSKLEQTAHLLDAVKTRADALERDAKDLERAGKTAEAADARVLLARLRAQEAAMAKEMNDLKNEIADSGRRAP
jgi:hypothetical protein